MLDSQQLVAGRDGVAPVDCRDLPANHIVDDLIGGHLAQRTRVHRAAIPQNGDAVADGAQLLQAMGDIDDAHLAVTQRPHDAEYLLGFGFG